jgi:DNA-binding NarL/FixJ family response regulator
MKKISILLVDDHKVVRQGLRALLSQAEDIEVVGEAEDGSQAVQMAVKNPPDIVVMDVVMPLVNGLESTKQLLKRVPSTKVLVLSSYSDDDYVQRLMDAGAAGYLSKQTAGDDLLLAIREVKKGNAFFSPVIARRRRDRRRQAFNDGKPSKKNLELTARETQVLQLVSNGCANKQVAQELGISIKTVEKHRQQVMNKLNIHEVAGLTRYVVSKGIVKQAGPLSRPSA